MDCIFCKIASGDLPAFKVFEDERVLAFLDINPGTRGHTLIIPRFHSKDLFALTDADSAAIMAAAQKIAPVLIRETGADGLNLHQSNGEAAGQVIFHYHMHLLPRWHGDSLCSPWTPGTSDSNDLQQFAERISRCITD
ncbi:MAG: HIT family protein [bacterium]|nr:HIT family protein [bacterium]